jgi:hypothetical protein
MGHDPLFKAILEAFLKDFLEWVPSSIGVSHALPRLGYGHGRSLNQHLSKVRLQCYHIFQQMLK